MDPYRNFLPDWYKDQIKLMTKLSKDLTADFANIHINTPDLQLPSKMDIIGKIAPQNQTAVQQLENYKWHITPQKFIDDATQQALDSMRANTLAALNPDITKINASLMALDTASAPIQKIVARAIEISTMPGLVDEETAPEEDIPNAVEEFVQDYPEEARTMTEELQHIVLETTGQSKEWWDELGAKKKCQIMAEIGRLMFVSAFSSATMPGGLATGTYLAGYLVYSMVSIVLISWDSDGDKGD